MTQNQRTTRGTPAFTTGGGGFTFEDRAGAWIVAAMLSGQMPLGPVGTPAAVGFQQKVPATALDDLLVAGADGPPTPRWLASVKSFNILGEHRHLAQFVADAWAQYLDDDFDRERDFVGFVCGQADPNRWSALLELVETVRNDSPNRLAKRIDAPGLFNETDRSLWRAFECPTDLATPSGLDVETSPALLLERLIPVLLDFRSAYSGAETQTREWCASALAAGHAHRAGDLYDAVLTLVSTVRPIGGSIDWSRLRREFGKRFPLALRPDVRPDWLVLEQHTVERLEAVQDSLFNGLRLPRKEARTLLAADGDDSVVYLAGPSGCGKTALAKAWLTESLGSQLWLNAQDLSDGLQGFGLRRCLRLPLVDVLALGQAPVQVVIDGLDRTYDEASFAATAAIARLASSSAGTIRLIVTSQAGALERVAQAIMEANGSTAATVVVGDLDDDDIQIALGERPSLRRLVFQGELNQVLRRPAMLQVVSQALDTTSAQALAAVQDEAEVADLWWSRLVLGTSAERTSRQEFLYGLASWTADELADALPFGELRSAGLSSYAGAVDALRREGILAASEDQYAFAHDLFGDWARYRSLGQWSSAEVVLGNKERFPSWHRAIRLFALRTLRRDGTERWLAQHQALRVAGHDIAADLHLDAPLFAADAEVRIGEMWPTLIADEGRLLTRMLKRFLLVASVPDPRGALMVAGGGPELQTYVAASWRIPIWVLWPPVVRVLAARVSEAVRAAPVQVALIADRWLRLTQKEYSARAEAARIGFAAGGFASTAYDAGVHLNEDDELKIWEAFLASAAERPDDVLAFALEVLRAADDDEPGDRR